MRVLHVDSARSWRGGQNQVLLTAQGMARRGHDVLVACRAGAPLEARVRAAGLEARALPFAGDLALPAAGGLRRVAREFRPEVVHVHDPHAAAAALALPRAAVLVASRRVDFPMRGPFSRWKYRRCRRLIAVSRAVSSVLERDGVDPARIRVVYEGVPDRPPAGGGDAALVALGVAPAAPVVGNVAALTAHKDHATLISAAAVLRAECAAARVVIVGEGELERELRALASRLRVTDTVLFAGFRSDLDALIPAFDVFCLSSQMEGLGTSLLDAMCYGRPIVATAAGGIPEAVEDGITGRVVAPRDPAALGRALAEVLRDQDRRDAMGAAARRRFLERFTADRMVEETLGVYAEVA